LFVHRNPPTLMPSYKIEGARRIDAADVDRYLAAHREVT